MNDPALAENMNGLTDLIFDYDCVARNVRSPHGGHDAGVRRFSFGLVRGLSFLIAPMMIDLS